MRLFLLSVTTRLRFRCEWVIPCASELVSSVSLLQHLPQDKILTHQRLLQLTFCPDSNASGKCVLPWGSGTKAVSAVVLIANGSSFAVHHLLQLTRRGRYLLSILGYDDAFYDHWFCGGLRDPWQVAAFGSDPDMLGRPVCKHNLDL